MCQREVETAGGLVMAMCGRAPQSISAKLKASHNNPDASFPFSNLSQSSLQLPSNMAAQMKNHWRAVAEDRLIPAVPVTLNISPAQAQPSICVPGCIDDVWSAAMYSRVAYENKMHLCSSHNF